MARTSVIEARGVGLVVEGSAHSVRLTLQDAVLAGLAEVALVMPTAPRSLVLVKVRDGEGVVDWEVRDREFDPGDGDRW